MIMNSLCGIRLHTAGIVIGWLGIVLSFIGIVIFALGLGFMDEITKAIMDHMDDRSKVTPARVHFMVVAICTFYVVINVINLCASAMLVAGTMKERHLMLIPWLINAGISVFISMISFISVCVMMIRSEAFGSIFLYMLTGGLGLAFQYVIWSAIYSLYKRIQTTRDQQQHLLPPTSSSTTTAYPVYTKI